MVTRMVQMMAVVTTVAANKHFNVAGMAQWRGIFEASDSDVVEN